MAGCINSGRRIRAYGSQQAFESAMATLAANFPALRKALRPRAEMIGWRAPVSYCSAHFVDAAPCGPRHHRHFSVVVLRGESKCDKGEPTSDDEGNPTN